jgi:hypothetical protein
MTNFRGSKWFFDGKSREIMIKLRDMLVLFGLYIQVVQTGDAK